MSLTAEVEHDLREAEIGRARATLARHNRLPPTDQDSGDFGSFGEFLSCVAHAGQRSTPATMRDRRLLALNSAPTAAGNEGSGSDGGFAVPPSFVHAIATKVFGDDSLLRATDMRTTQSNSITIPADETTPWQTSAGILTYWERELAQGVQSKPQLTNVTCKTAKLFALVPVTDEALEDSDALQQHVLAKAPQKIAFSIEQAVIAGLGAGEPLGILNSGGTITVAKDSGQGSATVTASNIRKIWSRLTTSARRNLTWLVHGDVESQLQQMVTTGSAGNVAASAPLYAAPTVGMPYGSILGRPIFPSEACSAPGTVGDIIAADLTQYLSVVKKIRSEMSIHLWFDYDVTAFRFIFRVGGQPLWQKTVTPYQGGTNARSFFVTLAAR